MTENNAAPTAPAPAPITEAKSKLAAGLLAIFLGWLGAHSFYLGKTGKGIIQIVVSIVTLGLGALWGFIEGIIILVKGGTDKNGVELV
jgi:TM2 domain-containing membrane protein YozV